ncbi:hypothetical protein [Thioclava sp. DLFJ4-1]|uniref:hypothetical protein n=1 Tax=Thioclava sp. DLFJ4-1 TaxID=1915313 RepID=UPI0011805736|nr:hypothetical protein [Thioclava sp. DLFJ4-1]
MSFDLDTILGSKVNTAIDVNRLLVPANSLGEYLRRFAEPALFHSDGFEPYDLSKSGSLTRICIEGRHFALTTDHQLRIQKYDLEQLCIHNSEARKIVTSHAAVFQNYRDQGPNLDAVLFEFTEAVMANSLSTHSWYRLSRRAFLEELPEPEILFAIGFPKDTNRIDFEVMGYEAAPFGVAGKPTQPFLPNRLAFRPAPTLTIDPAGMSGGPVFGVYLNGLRPTVFLAGIVTNASSCVFHFLSRGDIHRLIVKALG